MANVPARFDCPRCPGGHHLEKGDLRGVPLRLCKECRGLLMMRVDLDALVGAAGRDSGKGAQRAQYFERLRHASKFLSSSSSMLCPRCQYNMYEVGTAGLVIDFCLNCEAVWFDEGELKTALALAREHGAIDIIPDDLGGNDTAALIQTLLETVAASAPSAKK